MANETDNTLMNEYLETGERLPDSELDIMMAIWRLEQPCNTAQIKASLGDTKDWKAPTLISFLGRLETRGFLTSVKNGRERSYTALVTKKDYLSASVKSFVEKFCGGSFVQFLDLFFEGREFTEADIDGLVTWLEQRN